MKMLDLCSGLGGASEAMLRNGWEVIRIDNNPLLKDIPNTRIENILQWPKSMKFDPFDLIWISAPCLEFSVAYSAPKMVAKREGRPFEPNLDIIMKGKEIIERNNPRYYVYENVMGAIPHLTPILGKPRQIVGPFVLWSNLPLFQMPPGYKHNKYTNDKAYGHPLRANYRALIPYEISDKIRTLIECQSSILEFI